MGVTIITMPVIPTVNHFVAPLQHHTASRFWIIIKILSHFIALCHTFQHFLPRKAPLYACVCTVGRSISHFITR